MKKITRLVCLDLATKKSGISYWENGVYKESYVINYEKIDDIDERIELMGKRLIDALNYFEPNIIYTEDSFKGNNPKVVKCLSRLHGIVMGWCYINEAEHNLIYPSTWRKYIPDFPNGRNAKRAEQKEFSITYVTNKYGFKPQSDDEADAILIGESVLKMYEKEDK